MATRLKEQTSSWVTAANKAETVLRSFGDYETYLHAIEDDMKEVAEMLQQLSQAAAAKHAAKQTAQRWASLMHHEQDLPVFSC